MPDGALSIADLISNAEERSPIGRRIRLLEPLQVTEHWRRNSPEEWFPEHGMTGVIVAMPQPGYIGAGPQVRWNVGKTTWLGSCSKYEFLD